MSTFNLIPGDELFKDKFWFCDDSIQLNVSADKVWPWLVQMGTGRAGWYSYDLLDNFNKKSLNEIKPELQNIYKGMKIPGAFVSDFEENRFLTYQFGQAANMTYFLEKTENGTRLTTRVRVKGSALVLNLTLKPGHRFMQKKQFSELKKRIEFKTTSKQ